MYKRQYDDKDKVIINIAQKNENKTYSHRIGIASYGLDIHPYGVRDVYKRQ